jgi:septum site-determining protein MinC
LSSLVSQRHSLTFRQRSYMAFAITPLPPIPEWLATLDSSLARSKGFFAGHPVTLDLSTVNLNSTAIGELVASLNERNIGVMGLEGIDPAKWEAGLPPLLHAGRGPRTSEPQEPIARATPTSTVTQAANQKRPPGSLMVEEPVRSGQSVVFIEGDVTVLGSVGSGAEIIAGGSIHVYGTLRGRALAGATGNSRARIFCHCVEAELLAIDCCYRTADEIDDSLRRRPAQAWLEGSTLQISAMN